MLRLRGCRNQPQTSWGRGTLDPPDQQQHTGAPGLTTQVPPHSPSLETLNNLNSREGGEAAGLLLRAAGSVCESHGEAAGEVRRGLGAAAGQ